MLRRGRYRGFVESREGFPDDLGDIPEDEDRWDHINAFIREFARSDWGQQTLMEIEEFGLPGVDTAADLTLVQSAFLTNAKNERRRRRNQEMPNQ